MLKKTRTLEQIEEKMSQVEEHSLRYEVLSCVKRFKSSWIELGRYLMSIYKDKIYKEWGYLTFEAYCAKEIGIRKETALKLLRSYYFLEKEEPGYLKKEYLESADANKIPSYESIHTLQQAKNNKSLGIADYERMKQYVFAEGKPEKEIKDVYQAMVKSVEELEPEEVRRKRRVNYLRRIIGALNSIKKEVQINKFVSGKIISEIEQVISKIENELAE